jgi:hypothetical protein
MLMRPFHGDENDRCEYDIRQVTQQACQEQQAQRDRDRCQHDRQWGLRTGLVVHRRLRQPAGNRIALTDGSGEVRRAEGEQLLRGSISSPCFCANARADDMPSMYASKKQARASGTMPSMSRAPQRGQHEIR